MARTAPSAIALTLGLAVSAAVAVTVFAPRSQAAAVSPGASAPAESSSQVQPQASAPRGFEEKEKERNSIRSGSLSISASEKTNPNTIQITKPPEIEVDSSNIREVAKSAVQPIRESKRELTLTSKLPDSALAALIADPEAETVPVWRPAYASQGFRGARLDAFAVSQDGSVLAIAERTGTALGPNGTRIILVNTSDWQVIRIFTVGRLLKKLAFVPGSDELVSIAVPQPALEQKFGILHLDIKTGTAASFDELPLPPNGVIDPERIALQAVPDGIFCSGFSGTKVFFLPRKGNSAETPYPAIETAAPASALAITPDGKSIAAASQKAIEFFSLGDMTKPNSAKRLNFTTLDLGWAPVDLHFLGGTRTDFIICPVYADDSPPVIVRSSAKESLDGRSAGFAVPMNGGQQIGVAFKVKGRIDIVDPVTLEAADSVILEQLRPNTNGDVAFVFYLDPIQAFCVIDANGNCFAVGRKEGEKRWSKRIIWNGGAGKR